ncbi:hypothetical protein, partial [Caballeronia arationis]|uniref:hypothetical protein n=1 Tax=Caballeronia arationis TaxID=1777142 RepID=UPI000AD10346
TQYRKRGHVLTLLPEKLLSLVTFFAGAKKVTAAPHSTDYLSVSQKKHPNESLKGLSRKAPETSV